jgi:ribosome-binding factor A
LGVSGPEIRRSWRVPALVPVAGMSELHFGAIMVNFRKDRVAELIREVISEIVTKRIKDPRVQGVTITDVKMSADLKSARVFFCSLGDGMVERHKNGLESAEGFIRRELRNELDLKYIPQISFWYDTSFDNFHRINTLLKEVAPEGAPEEEPDAR